MFGKLIGNLLIELGASNKNMFC